MQKQYKVESYSPAVKGCGAIDMGWDSGRCKDFEKFLNEKATDGWKLHSYEYRSLKVRGCGGGTGSWLVCVFERDK